MNIALRCALHGSSLDTEIRRAFSNGEQGWVHDPSDVTDAMLAWRRNRFTWTEEFSNAAWGRQNMQTVTPKHDGIGDLLVPNTFNGGHAVNQIAAVVGAVNTVTVRAKAGGYNFLIIGLSSGAIAAWFNVNTGAIGVVAGGTATISPAPNGYWDCTFTGLSTTNNALIYPAVVSGSASYAGDGVSGILVARAQCESSPAATPYQRITDLTSEFLAAFPMPSLYQDAAGTMPVTGVEQPVGLMLDKRLGLATGPELLINTSFDAPDGWVLDTGWSIGGGAINKALGPENSAYALLGIATSRFRVFQVIIDLAVSSGTLGINLGGYFNYTITRSGTYTFRVCPTHQDSNTAAYLYAFAGFAGSVNFLSVREVLGNHAVQPTAINRPTFSARVNLLESNNNLAGAVWGRSNCSVTTSPRAAPDGTLTASLITTTTPSAPICLYITSPTVVASASYSWVLALSAGATDNALMGIYDSITGNFGAQGTITKLSGPGTVSVNATGTYSVSGLSTTEWTFVRVIRPSATSASARPFFYPGQGNGRTPVVGDSIHVWGNDLRPTNLDGLPVPQRVNTATDYDFAGFPKYLATNGVNQWMQTANINLTGTDQVTAVVGVRRNPSDSYQNYLSFGADPVGGNGTFWLVGIAPVDANGQGLTARGTNYQFLLSNPDPPPTTRILAGQLDIGGNPSMLLRLDGALVNSSATDLGTGNFGNHPVFLFALGGSSLFLNGQFYGSVVSARPSGVTPAERALFERFVNRNTRVTLAS